MSQVANHVLASTRKALVKFHEQAPEQVVYLARCCGRIYMGWEPAIKCGTCEQPAKNVELRDVRDLDNPAF
jgi:rubrerythrin